MSDDPTPAALVTGVGDDLHEDNIGSAIARVLAPDHTVVAADIRKPDRMAAALSGAVAAGGDVTKAEDCARWVAVAEEAGPLRVVAHAAGITRPTRPLEHIPPAEWDTVLRVNLTGTYLLCRAAIPALRRAGGGSIVLIASRAGRSPFPARGVTPVSTKAHYAASKAGVISLARSLALELAADGIRVNAVAPGPVEGAMIPQETWPRVAASVPLGRLAGPAEIAGAVRFLCSPEADYVTGQTLNVDGGLVLS